MDAVQLLDAPVPLHLTGEIGSIAGPTFTFDLANETDWTGVSHIEITTAGTRPTTSRFQVVMSSPSTSTTINRMLYPNDGTIFITTNGTWTTYPLNQTGTVISTANAWLNRNLFEPINSVAWATDWSQIHKEVKPRHHGVKKSTKQSIKRALKMMTGLGFEEEARIFLRGDTVEVSHPDSMLKFVIKKYSGSLIRRTEHPGYSTPYELQLYTKGDVHVANLCVYIEETPILDQVLGVAMFIQSGSEEIILSQANWSSLNRDMELREILALEYPYLEKKLHLGEQRFNNNYPRMNQ